MRPLSANEIPPNLSFYAIDPLYTPGVPLGWATTRIEETLDRGLDAQPVGAARRVSLVAPAEERRRDRRLRRLPAGGAAVRRSRSRHGRSSATTDYTDAAAPRDQALTYWVLPAGADRGGDARSRSTRAGRRGGAARSMRSRFATT